MAQPLDRRALLLASTAAAAACATPTPVPSAGGRQQLPDPNGEERLARQELFAHLKQVAHGQTPIAPAERAGRRRRAAELLALSKAEAVLVEPGPTLSWLTGISWGRSERLFAMVLYADGTHQWVCPSFERSRAQAKVDASAGLGGEVLEWAEHEYPYRLLAAELQRRGVQHLVIENSVRHVHVARLGRAWSGRLSLGDEWLVALRGQKDAHELQLLRRASELTQLAVREVALTLHTGLAGAEVAARMAAAHEALGMSGSWCLALVGPAAALLHGDASPRRLAKGDLLLVDTGATLLEYQSDTTRTWCVEGEPSSEAQRAWQATRTAQVAAFEAIRPGIPCKSVDAAARASLERSGFGAGYAALTHRLGHGIGVEGHEDPYFDGGSEVVLAPGMTFSNEPGVYREGSFGVRIEDIVVVTDTGADHFGNWQTDWRSPA